MGWILAMDFGTTASSVAVRDEGVDLLEVGGHTRVPSAVFCDEGGELIAGPQAVQRGAAQPDLLERNPKRRMGDRSVIIGDHRFSPAQLTAAVLRLLAETARSYRGGTEPDEVRITHPASWADTRLRALTEAAELAGLARPTLLPEPVAAAVHYADPRIAQGDLVAVYDLGGGTFDTAVLRRTADGFVLVGPAGGSDRLGGEDFDERLYQFVGDAIASHDPAAWEQLRYSDERAWVRANSALRAEVQAAKEALSSTADYTLYVSAPVDQEIRVTRDDLERLIASDLTRTVDELAGTVQRCGLEIGQISAVYLVGGSSRIPLVTRLLAERFGSVPVTWGDPQAAVVLGAAEAATSMLEATEAVASAAGTVRDGAGGVSPGGRSAQTADVAGGSGGASTAPSRPITSTGSARPSTAGPAPVLPAHDDVVGESAADAPTSVIPMVAEPRRRRLLPVALVAAAVVIVLVAVAVVLWMRREPASATPISLPGAVVGDQALTGTRTFSAAGDGTVGSSILFANGSNAPIKRMWVEAIPKSVASSVDDVRFSRQPDGVLLDDPVVYFVISLQPGRSETVSWTVNVPSGTTVDQSYLRTMAGEQERAQQDAGSQLKQQIAAVSSKSGIPVASSSPSTSASSTGASAGDLAGGEPITTSPSSSAPLTSSTLPGSSAGVTTSLGGSAISTSRSTSTSTTKTKPTKKTRTTKTSATTTTRPNEPGTVYVTNPPVVVVTHQPAPPSTTSRRTTVAPPKTTVKKTTTTKKTTSSKKATTTKPPAPTISWTSFPSTTTLSELSSWSSSVKAAAKASNGAAVTFTASGLPPWYTMHSNGIITGTAPSTALNVTVDRRPPGSDPNAPSNGGIKSVKYTVKLTAKVSGTSVTSAKSFTLYVRDTYRKMPQYVGYYGCGGTSGCGDPSSLPNVAAVSTPSFKCDSPYPLADSGKVLSQSVAPGTDIAWGAPVLYHMKGTAPAGTKPPIAGQCQ